MSDYVIVMALTIAFVLGIVWLLRAVLAEEPEPEVEYVEAWKREPVLDVHMMADYYGITLRQVRYRCEVGDIPTFRRSGVYLAWAGDLPPKHEITE